MGTFVLFERRIPMTDKEKLIQCITNLTDDEAEEFIFFLKTIPSSEEGVMLLPQNNYPQDQTVSV